MSSRDIEILQVLYLLQGEAYDTHIHARGRSIFGTDWGGSIKMAKQSHKFQYCPWIYMRLGALRKHGLVERTSTDGSFNFGLWKLTPEGYAFLKSIPKSSQHKNLRYRLHSTPNIAA